MKKLIFYLFLILSSLVIIYCNDDSLSVSDNSLSGLFKATTFVEPGINDTGVDILANNGILTVQFDENFTASGHLLIPKNIGSNYSSVDTNYSGTYTINGDTVRFQNTNEVLNNPDVYFIKRDSNLETPDYQGRWALFKIILKKQ